MAQAVPNLCVSRKVFLKHQVNWNTVYGAILFLPLQNIWSADIPWRFGTSICPCWLEVMYQLRSFVCISIINLGLMTCCAGVLLISSRRHIFGKPAIALWLTRKRLSTRATSHVFVVVDLYASWLVILISCRIIMTASQGVY